MTLGTLQVTTPSDREILMTRVFDAPRTLVFDAHTKPELLKQWLGLMPGWSWVVCEIDLRVGGALRYLWRGPDGQEMGMRGVFREVARPERVVNTERFDPGWYPGEAEDTLSLVERNGRTTLTLSVLYDSKLTRDMVLKSPMAKGMAVGFDKLAELLGALAEGGGK